MLRALEHDAASDPAWLKALGGADRRLLDRRLAWAVAAPPSDGDLPAAGPALDLLRGALCASLDMRLRDPTDASKPFDDLWWPVAQAAVDQLQDQVQPRLGFAVADGAWTELAVALVERLCEVTTPTLWSLFQRDRGLGAALLARVDAQFSLVGLVREVYEAFIRRHRRDGLASVLAEFPVLGRFVATLLAQWQHNQAEMLLRLASDREALSGPGWSLPAGWPLASVRCGLSDPHRGARVVAILGFGDDERRVSIVYKPKDLRLDAAFQSLVADLHPSTSNTLRAVNVLSRADYGYMAHVQHTPCRDDDELRRFYRNAGRLLALLYVLGCTDCHAENLIACGDSLFLVDAETLLEGVVPDHSRGSGERQPALPETGLQRSLSDSVLRVGMLPVWRFLGLEKIPVDMSALGSDVPSRSHQTRHGWKWVNSDAMVLGPVDGPAELPTSLPAGIGQPHPLPRHRQELAEGFRDEAARVVASRGELLDARGPIERLAGLPRRLVVRNTTVYYAVREQQLAPQALVSDGAQALVLEQLARTFLVTEECPPHWPLFASEREQMSRLDIPFFWHPTDGCDLLAEHGRMVVPGFVEVSGLAATRVRLQQLDDDAIDFQLRLIRGVLDARWDTSTPVQGADSVAVQPALPQVDTPHRCNLPQSGRDQADALLQRLQSQAFEDELGTRDWLGPALGADSRSICFGAVGYTLYGGSLGVAMLQAALGQRRGAGGVLRLLLNLTEKADNSALQRWWQGQPLGLNGGGGILLGLQALDRLGAEPPPGWSSYHALAARIMQGLTPERIRADGQLDVMGGVAGLIGALLGSGRPQTHALAVMAGDHLVARQLQNGGWPQPSATALSLPLTGFSHGTAGFAACLCALHRHTGEGRFLDGARGALAYERSCFEPVERNWPYRPTLRSSPAQMTAWCHGAPGVALGRLCLQGTPLWDDTAAAETALALASTAAAVPAFDHLCCGSFGLVAVLRAAAARLQDPAWHTAAEATARFAISRAQALHGDLPSAAAGSSAFLHPSLFTGASGIGLALLGSSAGDECLQQVLSAGCLP